MFLERRREIEEKIERANKLETYVKNAKVYDESVLQVKDVMDVLLNGKLTGASAEEIWEVYKGQYRERKEMILSNMNSAYDLLNKNVPVFECGEPTLGLRLSARQGHVSGNVVRCMARGETDNAVGEFIDCLMDNSKTEKYESPAEYLKRKLSINEVILLKTLSLVISEFISVSVA